ncbi:hypothetical protein [Allosphingosinicella vermicomposti]|nr:hypothetical protein [Allosphingosinicella vermicomposti]
MTTTTQEVKIISTLFEMIVRQYAPSAPRELKKVGSGALCQP